MSAFASSTAWDTEQAQEGNKTGAQQSPYALAISCTKRIDRHVGAQAGN